MTPRAAKDNMVKVGQVTLSVEELQTLLENAAEAGAQRTLKHLGLADERGVQDLREVRDLLGAWRAAKEQAWRTFVQIGTTALLVALLAGVTFSLWERK